MVQGPGHGSPLFENGILKGPNALYNAQRLEGMPVCVHVVWAGRSPL
jgi:DNA-binding Lrp family transcriptional regulator